MAKDDKGQWRPGGRPPQAGRDGGERSGAGRGEGRRGDRTDQRDGQRDGRSETKGSAFKPRKPVVKPTRNSDIKTWRAEPAGPDTPRRPSLEERTRHLRPKREGEEARDENRPQRRDGEHSPGRDGERREVRGYVARDPYDGPRDKGPRAPGGKPFAGRSTAGKTHDGFRARPQRPDRAARPDSAPRDDRGDRPDRAGRSDRASRPDRGDRPARPERAPPRERVEAVPAMAGAPSESMRISKAMARAGLCSRRDAERWIAEGRVNVNGTVIDSPALDVGPADRVLVDDALLPPPEPVRMWRYHKPKGLVTTHADPEGRDTVFSTLPDDMPRVISVGRLDFNTEGLLLLTTSGAVARHLELPATGWLRRYRVRAFGEITQDGLDALKDGIEIEGVQYGAIEATLDSVQGSNVWLTIGLREGKNREVRTILSSLGLDVNRLIRVSYGPFQLLDLEPGKVEIVRRKVLAEQLGPDLAAELGLDGEADAAEQLPPRQGFRIRPRPDGGRDAPRDRREAPRGRPDAPRDRRDSPLGRRDDRGERGGRVARDDRPPRDDKGERSYTGRPSTYRGRAPGDGDSPSGYRMKGQGDRGPPRDRGDGGGKPAFRDKPSGFRAKSFGDRDAGGRADRGPPRDRGDRDGKPAFRDKPSGFRAKSFGDRDAGGRADRGPPRERGDRDGKPAFRDKPSGFRARETGEPRDRPPRESGERDGKPGFRGKPGGFKGKPGFRGKPSGSRGPGGAGGGPSRGPGGGGGRGGSGGPRGGGGGRSGGGRSGK